MSLFAFMRAPKEIRSGLPRERVLFAAKLLVMIAAFWYVASLANVGDALALMRNQNFALVALAALAILIQILLGALRWRAILVASARQDSADISPSLAFRLYYTSIFFNSFLPGTFGGDVIRTMLTRALGVTAAASVNSVILDRIVTLVTLLVMVLPALPLIWSGIGISSAILIAAITTIFALVIVYFGLGHINWLASLKIWTDRAILSFRRALCNLISHPGPLLLAVPLAFGAHLAYCLTAFILAQSLGVQLGFIDTLTLMPLVLLFSSVPISIGGWGVRELGAIGLLGLVEVPSHEAVMISLQLGVLTLLMSLSGVIFWIGIRARATAQ